MTSKSRLALVTAVAVAMSISTTARAQVTQTAQDPFAPLHYGGVLAPAPPHDRFTDHVVWAANPTRAQVIAAFPSDVTSAGRTLWSCAIQDDGHLEDCRLQKSWPVKEGFGRAARSLMPEFQLSAPVTGAASLNHSRVVFEVDLFNDLLRVKDIPGSCPPEFCSRAGPLR